MRKFWFLVSFPLFVQVAAQAQTKRPGTPHKAGTIQKARKAAKPTAAARVMPVPKVDTPTVAPPPPPPVVAADTTQDTTAIAKVVKAAGDSVVAQVKAPIVQIPVTTHSLIIPGVLFAYGVLTLNETKLREVNETAQEVIWDGRKRTGPFIEDYGLLLPALTVYGLNAFGIKGQNNFVDRSILYGMSNLVANGLSFGIKKLSIEQRPDSSDRYSFPSGHTAEAFVSAEFLRLEYRGRIHWSVIAAGYAVGVGTAYMRMYHNKHWLSDVVAGAGVGIVSTRFSYYLYPIVKKWVFGSRKIKADAMLIPTYQNGMFGVAAALRF